MRSSFQYLKKEGMDPVYSRWCRWWHADLPALAHFLYSLPYFSLPSRKGLLTYTRVQQPLQMSRLSNRVGDTYRIRETVPLHPFTSEPTEYLSLGHLLDRIPHRPTDPVYQGFLSMILRNAPYIDHSDVIAARQKGILKELRAALNVYEPIKLNYDPILSPDRSSKYQRMAPNLPLDPHLHDEIYACFTSTIPLLERATFYPKLSTKTIGDLAMEASAGILHNLNMEVCTSHPRTLVEVERILHETGIELQGPVEMRLAWKYNDLKPRVYYALGPTAHSASKFIQPILNTILDCFPPVHRYNRFEIPKDQLLSTDIDLVIYDYSDFTSSLHQILDFLRAVAAFYKAHDTHVTIVDAIHGPVSVSLGDLLQDYVDVCCIDPDFDIAKVLPAEDLEHLLLRHNCGMLGVPGNISSCTLLHGIHLSIIVRALTAARCVGDDALLQILLGRDPHRWGVLVDQIQNIGIVAEDKTERWTSDDEERFDTEGWHYCKRPITRLDNRIRVGALYIWPSLAHILGLSDPHHTEFIGSLDDRRLRFLNQWKRLLTRLHILQENITDESRSLLKAFQDHAYDSLDFKRGIRGLFRVSPSLTLVVPPRMTPEEFGSDWISMTIQVIEAGLHFLPAFRSQDMTGYGVLDEEFESSATQKLSYLSKIGYVERLGIVNEWVELGPHVSEEVNRMHLSLQFSMTYSWRVVKDYPAWASSL
jgi:hypothetical protein